MNKEIIEMQKGCTATCAVILTCEYGDLTPSVRMGADVSNDFLFNCEVPPFAQKLTARASGREICYFIIYGIDEISEREQEKFVGLVKDRELNGYQLPDNVVIVFTVKDKNRVKKIGSSLNHFAVVAI